MCSLSLMLLAACDEVQEQDKTPTDKQEVTEKSQSPKKQVAFSGTYTGVFPCEDCEGVISTYTFKKDHTYVQTTAYKGNEGHDYEMSGKWKTNNDTLMTEDSLGGKERFIIDVNFIQQIDDEGFRMQGEDESEFIWKKGAKTPA